MCDRVWVMKRNIIFSTVCWWNPRLILPLYSLHWTRLTGSCPTRSVPTYKSLARFFLVDQYSSTCLTMNVWILRLITHFPFPPFILPMRCATTCHRPHKKLKILSVDQCIPDPTIPFLVEIRSMMTKRNKSWPVAAWIVKLMKPWQAEGTRSRRRWRKVVRMPNHLQEWLVTPKLSPLPCV